MKQSNSASINFTVIYIVKDRLQSHLRMHEVPVFCLPPGPAEHRGKTSAHASILLRLA